MQKPDRVMMWVAENLWACSRICRRLRHPWLVRDLHQAQGVYLGFCESLLPQTVQAEDVIFLTTTEWFCGLSTNRSVLICGICGTTGQGDRFRWPATNVNILGTSHIPYHQCRFHIPRHQEETHIPCCHNGRYRLSLFEQLSMERLWDVRGCVDRCFPHG